MENLTVRELFDRLGRPRVRAALFGDHEGLESDAPGFKTVALHVSKGVIPAAWFDVVDALCKEDGLETPRYLFSFKRPDGPVTGAGRDAA
ncbi:hypothetical protein [Salipiger thiooxidans]|uniref:hypothetical protein n=1 Tax=Salipiger thiooxidans TaxID=282683 RepID=UPI001CF9491E|nr:hypothetical protein [Salipiger thiooxidans]